ncbi:hypothetical protein P7C73_g1143, partial [Tremellales sp. Uapishka_1]
MSQALSILQSNQSVLGREHVFVHEGKLQYIEEVGENGSAPTYQDALGAPIETRSPLGHEVGFWTATFLNVSMLIGTGIFSTPASILKGTGSVGLALIYWVLGWFISMAGISVYLEFCSYFPSRSGSEAVYLEQAYPKPRYFFPVAFAVQSVLLSFNSSNAIVLAQYIFRMTGHAGSDWAQKGVAIAGYTVICLRGGVKSIRHPKANFEDSFHGTSKDGYNLSNALVNIIFSYGGFNNSFALANEIKNPVATIKRTSTVAVSIVAILYFLVNVAYFAALPKADIIASTQVTASLFFQRVFGEKAAKGLTILPVLSAGGNILAVLIGQTRLIREIGRQGVIPFPRFWTSTRPFGTPAGPILIKWVVTIIMILAPPAGDAFSFIVALSNYPNSFFLGLMTLGLFFVRRERKLLNLPKSEYRSWTFVVVFYLASILFLLIMPWVPPKGGINAGAFHFAYFTSSLVGLGCIGICGIYYVFWAKWFPKWGQYEHRPSVVELDNGGLTHSIIKVKLDALAQWDAEHDPSGRQLFAPIDAEAESEDFKEKV